MEKIKERERIHIKNRYQNKTNVRYELVDEFGMSERDYIIAAESARRIMSVLYNN